MWVFAEQVGTAIAGLFGFKLLTNILGPSEFGIFILANTVVVLISVNFLFGPLGLGLMRVWSISQACGDLGTFYRAQYGFNSIFLLPLNLYGLRDNFNPRNSYVIPAL